MVTGHASGARLSPERRAELIDAIYAAATDESLWPAFFDKVQGSIGGYATIYERCDRDPSSHQIHAGNLDPSSIDTYNATYNSKNPWAISRLNQASAIVTGERMIRPQELEKTEFYSDWLRPQGLKHALTCNLQTEKGRSLNLGLVRESRLGEYSAEESQLLHSLLPHLKRAVEISHRLRIADARTAATATALQGLGMAAVLVDNGGRVLFANASAETFFNDRRGWSLRSGRLAGGSLSSEAALSSAIAGATSRETEARGADLVPLTSARDEDGLSVAVLPFEENEGVLLKTGPLALLLVSDERRRIDVSQERLQSRFGLTAAEARLAAALCAGGTVNDYAAAASVSVTTVKTHLSSLFQKTGEARQTDLVRSILSDPLMLLEPTR